MSHCERRVSKPNRRPPAKKLEEQDGRLILETEHEATLWLWAHPELLGWKREIVWLFSPVNDRHGYPGDLWGVDSDGVLLLVETKLSKKGRQTCAPFEDFLGLRPTNPHFRAEALKSRWCDLYKHETKWLSLPTPMSGVGEKTMPGVLPYSNKRRVANLWPELYRSICEEKISRPRYEKTVEKHLSVRRGRGPIRYFGVIAVSGNAEPNLSAKGLKERKKLGDAVAGVRVLEARPSGSQITLCGYELPI